jgi:hypothetical protein
LDNKTSLPQATDAYVTDFPLTESPISEGGKWLLGKNDGIDWFNISTKAGLAHGDVTVGEYTDPIAVLKGTWSADQGAEGVVFSRNPTTSCWQEVELQLRSSISAHRITGYEVFFRCLKTAEGYVQVARWNGPVRDFTYLKQLFGEQYGVKNGDVVRASIIGNVIKAYINNIEVLSVTDDTFTSGNPGIGFNYGCGNTYEDFGFTRFTAYNLKSIK